MSRQILMVCAILGIGCVIGIGLTNLTSPVFAGPDSIGGGGWGIVAGKSAFVLYDSGTGKSWVMISEDDELHRAWFPLKRLNTDSEVHNWRVQKAAAK